MRRALRSGLLTLLALVLAVAGGVSYPGWRQSVPLPRVTANPPSLLGQRTPVAVTVEAAGGTLAHIELRLVQAGRSVVLARKDDPGRRAEVGATLEAVAGQLRDGSATVEVWASDTFWRPLRFDDRPAIAMPITIDLTPPTLDVVAATRYVRPGGTGVVVVRAADAVRVEARVGTLAFPTFPVSGAGTGMRTALFALPHDVARGTPLSVVAADEAGNTTSRGIAAELLPRTFRGATIEIRDGFLQAKVPELLPQHPPSRPLVEGFLVINREQRRQAEAEKRRVAAASADRPLWSGAFVQPRNTKVFSNFAETRTYRYNGREIDTQVHLGYDLASTRQAPVPAANTGVVTFAGPLTIYGNTVIVNHGLGLQTLYAHLSSVGVKVGDRVDRGQELGRTGTTGLALADHLHYEVLVHGLAVTPLEWWDARWIQNHVAAPLELAGLVRDPGSGTDGRRRP